MRGDQTTPTFAWSDAWLLLALIYARNPGDLKLIRQIGDFINRAIFTTAELRGGLRRLITAGLAYRVGRKATAAPKVIAWYERLTAGKRNTYALKDLERVERFLRTYGPIIRQ